MKLFITKTLVLSLLYSFEAFAGHPQKGFMTDLPGFANKAGFKVPCWPFDDKGNFKLPCWPFDNKGKFKSTDWPFNDNGAQGRLSDSPDIGSNPANFANGVQKAGFKLSGDIGRWSNFPAETDILVPPAVGSDMFFVISKGNTVRAYTLERRKLVWSVPIKGSLKNASMLFHGGVVYVAADDYLMALSALRGNEVFYCKLPSSVLSALCVHNGLCYVQTAQGLHAINVVNGVGKILKLPVEAAPLRQFSPVIYKDKVIFTDCSGRLAISDIFKGPARLIEFSGKPDSPIVSQPLLN